ncbi:MAG: OmpH family outer membrane protein [Bacteroidaceae bacterium]|nr:OmpH family outer membrane protein [Bacteroidaceae bacterium]
MKAFDVLTTTRVLCLACIMAWGQMLTAQNETDTLSDTQIGTLPKTQAIIIGQISSNSILPHMPQYKAVQQNMKTLKEQYEAEAKKSENDFQRKFEEFMQGQKEFPQTILEKRQNELQAMLETNATFRIKVQALLADAEKAMMADVRSEMNDVIATVAKERGVSIVFDIDGGSVPFIVNGLAMDLTDAVIQQLGIEENAE